MRAAVPMKPNGRYTERPSPFAELIEKDKAFRERRSGYGQQGVYHSRDGQGGVQQGVYHSRGGQSDAQSSQCVRSDKNQASIQNSVTQNSTVQNAGAVSGAVKKIYLRVKNIETREAKKAKNIIEIFDGTTSVAFYETDSKQYLNFSGMLDATPFVIGELKKLLGEENVILK